MYKESICVVCKMRKRFKFIWPIKADFTKSGPMRVWENWQKEILRAVMEIGFLGNVVGQDIIHGKIIIYSIA